MLVFCSRRNPYPFCSPLSRYGDALDGPDDSLNDKVLYPCGLIANTFFNDVIENPCVYEDGGGPLCVPLGGPNWQKRSVPVVAFILRLVAQ